MLAVIDSTDRRVILTICSALLVVIAVVDYLSGEELASSVVYLIPVALVGWRFDIRVSGPFALAATLTWIVVMMLLGAQYANPWVGTWDGVSRFIVYFSFAVLLGHVRSSLEHARQMALTDHLTGVANARYFHDLAERELEHCRRHGSAFTLAYIDIDDFKDINDAMGHSGGDRVIRGVASALSRSIRRVDQVARQGGDEFMLFLHEIDPDQADFVLKQIHSRVSNRLAEQGISVSLSIGGVTWDVPPETLDTAIHAADRVMYEVKRNKKGSVLHRAADTSRPDPPPSSASSRDAIPPTAAI